MPESKIIHKKNFLLLLLSSIVIISLSYWILTNREVALTPIEKSNNQPFYKGTKESTQVSIFAENIPQITDIEITPNGKYMLAGSLTGTIYAFGKVDNEWKLQTKPFFEVNTSQPGYPPREAGLTGIILGADFEKSGDVFFNYSFAVNDKLFKNRVARVTLAKDGQRINKVCCSTVKGTNPKIIFEANTPGAVAHQIEDGVSLTVDGSPHILFGVGEGFQASRALDPQAESGKLILIDRSGRKSAGTRPFENPNIQAIGLRNPPDIAVNPENGKVAVADTGPDNYDRLIYSKLVDIGGENVKRISLNWDGTEQSLKNIVPDPFESGDMIIYRWKPTKTPVALNFSKNGKLLVTLFGKSGSKSNKPGKEILLGTITEGRQDRIVFETLVTRSPEGEGKLGNPIATAIDPITGEIYFSDIMEGRIYVVKGVN